MKYMEQLRKSQALKSFPPCVDGKAIKAPFKQDNQNCYALLEVVSSDTTGPIAPTDSEGSKYVQILVDACTGWTDIQAMRKKSDVGKAIIRFLEKIQHLCEIKA